MILDVLIVDSHSDLNIYKQGSANGSNGCCGGGKKQSSASYEANDIDFNEYAGQYTALLGVLLLRLAQLTYLSIRLLQDLCCEAMKL